MKYELCHLDVNGSEDGGWEVNNTMRSGTTIDILDGDTDDDIIKECIRAGWLKPQVTSNDVEVEDTGDGSLIGINQASDGMFLFELRLVDEPASETASPEQTAGLRHGMKYEFVHLDVLGNEEDGFEVNDQWGSGQTVEISDNASDQDILNLCIEEGWLKPSATLDKVDIDQSDEYMINIDDASNGQPVFSLSLVDEPASETASPEQTAGLRHGDRVSGYSSLLKKNVAGIAVRREASDIWLVKTAGAVIPMFESEIKKAAIKYAVNEDEVQDVKLLTKVLEHEVEEMTDGDEKTEVTARIAEFRDRLAALEQDNIMNNPSYFGASRMADLGMPAPSMGGAPEAVADAGGDGMEISADLFKSAEQIEEEKRFKGDEKSHSVMDGVKGGGGSEQGSQSNAPFVGGGKRKAGRFTGTPELPTKQCEKCGGTGEIVIKNDDEEDPTSVFYNNPETETCPACNGRGTIYVMDFGDDDVEASRRSAADSESPIEIGDRVRYLTIDLETEADTEVEGTVDSIYDNGDVVIRLDDGSIDQGVEMDRLEKIGNRKTAADSESIIICPVCNIKLQTWNSPAEDFDPEKCRPCPVDGSLGTLVPRTDPALRIEKVRLSSMKHKAYSDSMAAAIDDALESNDGNWSVLSDEQLKYALQHVDDQQFSFSPDMKDGLRDICNGRGIMAMKRKADINDFQVGDKVRVNGLASEISGIETGEVYFIDTERGTISVQSDVPLGETGHESGGYIQNGYAPEDLEKIGMKRKAEPMSTQLGPDLIVTDSVGEPLDSDDYVANIETNEEGVVMEMGEGQVFVQYNSGRVEWTDASQLIKMGHKKIADMDIKPGDPLTYRGPAGSDIPVTAVEAPDMATNTIMVFFGEFADGERDRVPLDSVEKV